jgi:hypothetical protein
MMPTRADIEAAAPKCPHPVTLQRGGKFSPIQCARPMRWVDDDASGLWVCCSHGSKLTGYEAAERAGLAKMRYVDAA